MHEALFWDAIEGTRVRCGLCPHRCLIEERAAGICGVRINMGGKLFSAGYGSVSSIALDPIEKKPLYRFHPGRKILSIGGFGCNLRCPFCQNYEISMDRGAIAEICGEMERKPGSGSRDSDGSAGRRGNKTAPGGDRAGGYRSQTSPDDIVAAAVAAIPKGNIGVAYTYNEPLISYEFVYDCAALVHAAKLSNVLVTNGFIERGPLEALLPLVDAMNIDLKGFSDDFYKNAGGRLNPVLSTIEASVKHCHVEVTTLVIPGENEGDVEDIARWLASIDPDIPLHLSRFFPNYLYSGRAPTTRESIFKLQETARVYLNHVYVGNM